VNKDKDDPLLREALSQKPDVVSKGRRAPPGTPKNIIEAPDPKLSKLIPLNDASHNLQTLQLQRDRTVAEAKRLPVHLDAEFERDYL
jgi:hypothetical protein